MKVGYDLFSLACELQEYHVVSDLLQKKKTRRELPESSRLELLEKYSEFNFAVSDTEDKTSGSLNS